MKETGETIHITGNSSRLETETAVNALIGC